MLESKEPIRLRRSRVFIVGEGGVGKSSLLHALLNKSIKNIKSTVGASISTVNATNMHKWEEMPGTETEQVIVSILGLNCTDDVCIH